MNLKINGSNNNISIIVVDNSQQLQPSKEQQPPSVTQQPKTEKKFNRDKWNYLLSVAKWLWPIILFLLGVTAHNTS